MSFDELDNWIDINAPNLNKSVLHTQVASISEDGGGIQTCEVQFVLDDLDSVDIDCVHIYDDSIEVFNGIGQNCTITVPVGQNGTYFWLGSRTIYTVVTEGGIEYDEDEGCLLITGDGKVTLSPSTSSK